MINRITQLLFLAYSFCCHAVCSNVPENLKKEYASEQGKAFGFTLALKGFLSIAEVVKEHTWPNDPALLGIQRVGKTLKTAE